MPWSSAPRRRRRWRHDRGHHHALRSSQQPGRDGFAQLLRAEWTKFRTVRGWVICIIAAAALTALATVALANIAGGKQNPGANPPVAIGPDGKGVTDDFSFVHRPLAGDGTITVRVTSLTGTEQVPGEADRRGAVPHSQAWAKAGIIIKESTRAGSAYAAMMVTPGHGADQSTTFTIRPACLARPPRRHRAGCG